MTLLTATRELATYQRRCSVDGARAIFGALAPGAVAPDAAELAAEGFDTAVYPSFTAASTTVIPRIADPVPDRAPAVAKPGRPAGQLRWLPVGAAILVALLMITGIVFAVTSAGSSTGGASNRRDTAASVEPSAITVDGVNFQPRGDNREPECAKHATGDVQKWLQNNKCTELIRLRFESTVDNRKAAVLVAVLRFTDPSSATELRRVADTPGAGTVVDAAAEGTAWPNGGKPTFDSAAYASGREGNSVKLVQAVWLGQASTPDDGRLRDVAARALQLPVEA